jgi:hypothetical protein
MEEHAFNYEAEVWLNVSELVPSLREFTAGINKAMAGFGFSEKMSLRGPCLTVRCGVCREMTGEEMGLMKTAIEKAITEGFPETHPEVKSFRLVTTVPQGGA